jgi:AraC-like DNA-binding protein
MTSLTLDWLHLITLLGAVQGVVLAGALASKKSNRTANRLLAALMLSFSISLATTVYHGGKFEQRFPHFFGAGYPQPFLFGPLVYLYAITAADRSRRLTWRDALHFAPFLVAVLVVLPTYLASGAEKLEFYARLQRGDIPLQVRILDPLKLVSGITYATATIVFLLRHRGRVKASYSSTERVNLQWLLWLGLSSGFVWLMAVVFDLMERGGVGLGQSADDIIALAVAIIVYGIGYMGLRQPEIFRYETAEYPVPVEMLPEPDAEARPSAPRYERSGLTERQADRLRDALIAMMDKERPWLESELTLADLASRLSTTPHRLSEVLNAQVGQSFYDFVNGYRVREVQRRITAGDAKQVKMLALALDAGFASKSTFNVVFKKHTNQTPSDYQQAAGV